MAKRSSSADDFALAEELLLSEIVDGIQGEDLEQLDAKFAEQLHVQDAILLSVKDQSKPSSTPAATSKSKTKPRKSATKKSTSSSGQSSLSYCEICVERKKRRKMFPNSACSHSFCSDCIIKYVNAKLDQKESRIMCPEENCRVMLELDSCRSLLPKEVVSRWEDSLCEALLRQTGGRVDCPFEGCPGFFHDDNQGQDERQQVIAECECTFCHRLFCAKCHVPWHSGIDCDEYQKLNEGEIMVRNLAKQNKWRTCPSCHHMVERIEGCPHMTCRCKFEFCYACGAKWTPDHGGCQRN